MRPVLIADDHVAGFFFREQISPGPLVVDLPHLPLPVQRDPEPAVLKPALRDVEPGRTVLRRRSLLRPEGPVSLRRHVLRAEDPAVFRFLGWKAAISVPYGTCIRPRRHPEAHDPRSLKGIGIEHSQRAGRRADPVRQKLKVRGLHVPILLKQREILTLRVLVDLMNRGTGQNIVELIPQQRDPLPVKRLLRIGRARQMRRHHRIRLGVLQRELRAPVPLLVPRHRGVRAAVILKIQLAPPDRKSLRSRGLPVEILEKRPRGRHLRPRKARNPLRHPPLVLKLAAGRAAAPVAVAETAEHLIVQVLVVVARPRALHLGRIQEAVVSREMPGLRPVLLRRPVVVAGRDEMREPPRAVDAFPEKRIDGHHVRLVPRNLRGHEIPDAAELHDLRQCRGIAEHVRQPENLAVLPELLPEKTLSVEKLP